MDMKTAGKFKYALNGIYWISTCQNVILYEYTVIFVYHRQQRMKVIDCEDFY